MSRRLEEQVQAKRNNIWQEWVRAAEADSKARQFGWIKGKHTKPAEEEAGYGFMPDSTEAVIGHKKKYWEHFWHRTATSRNDIEEVERADEVLRMDELSAVDEATVWQ